MISNANVQQNQLLSTPQNSKELQDLCNLISLPSILKNCDNRLQEVNSVAEKLLSKPKKAKIK